MGHNEAVLRLTGAKLIFREPKLLMGISISFVTQERKKNFCCDNFLKESLEIPGLIWSVVGCEMYTNWCTSFFFNLIIIWLQLYLFFMNEWNAE